MPPGSGIDEIYNTCCGMGEAINFVENLRGLARNRVTVDRSPKDQSRGVEDGRRSSTRLSIAYIINHTLRQ